MAVSSAVRELSHRSAMVEQLPYKRPIQVQFLTMGPRTPNGVSPLNALVEGSIPSRPTKNMYITKRHISRPNWVGDHYECCHGDFCRILPDAGFYLWFGPYHLMDLDAMYFMGNEL